MIVLEKLYGFVNSANKVSRDWNCDRRCSVVLAVLTSVTVIIQVRKVWILR